MTKTVAVIQRPPRLLDRAATIADVAAEVADVANRGASLAVFPEAHVPGYPEWIWRLRPGDPDDYHLSHLLYGQLVEQAVDLGSDDLDPVRAAAEDGDVTVVLGVHEVDRRFSGTTLFNTLVTIGPDGTLLNRHRKLVPTHPERLIWSPGDGAGLRVVDTPVGRLGGLICWENYMPLARYALHAAGEEVHIASTWDEGDGWVGTMQHIAREGRCWVIGSGSPRRVSDVPDDFPDRDRLYGDLDPDQWLNGGDSVIVDPRGQVVAGPMRREVGVLTAEVDPGLVAESRHMLDVSGHYGRPDVFSLSVDRSERRPVSDAGPPT